MTSLLCQDCDGEATGLDATMREPQCSTCYDREARLFAIAHNFRNGIDAAAAYAVQAGAAAGWDAASVRDVLGAVIEDMAVGMGVA
jgi:hypothetical protein